MECFGDFWSVHQERVVVDGDASSWSCASVVLLAPKSSKDFQDVVEEDMEEKKTVDLRDIVKQKALKHRTFYVNLIDDAGHEPSISNMTENSQTGAKCRRRKKGVFEISCDRNLADFKSVRQLREQYQAMLEKTYRNLSGEEKTPEKCEVLLMPPSSGYCSSSASGASDDEKEKSCWFGKKLLRRSASSDSAVHSDEDGQVVIESNWGEKKEEAEIAFSGSPYSPRGSIDHSNVPSRLLLESKFVPLPFDRKSSIDHVPEVSFSESRRQSCFSEGDERARYRYWRTPSVVVSDYSDDAIQGLTLEDIEYIRDKRERSFSPCSSLHSSCSNLNYCGSSISVIDDDYVICKPYRKSSNCSTCSTLSDEEEHFQEPQPPERKKEVSQNFSSPPC